MHQLLKNWAILHHPHQWIKFMNSYLKHLETSEVKLERIRRDSRTLSFTGLEKVIANAHDAMITAKLKNIRMEIKKEGDL